jgi:chromosome segregation ATPase
MKSDLSLVGCKKKKKKRREGKKEKKKIMRKNEANEGRRIGSKSIANVWSKAGAAFLPPLAARLVNLLSVTRKLHYTIEMIAGRHSKLTLLFRGPSPRPGKYLSRPDSGSRVCTRT